MTIIDPATVDLNDTEYTVSPEAPITPADPRGDAAELRRLQKIIADKDYIIDDLNRRLRQELAARQTIAQLRGEADGR